MEASELLTTNRKALTVNLDEAKYTLAVEIHEGWLETHCYLNMEALAEQKKSQLHGVELAAA